jgi:hypothetical protein
MQGLKPSILMGKLKQSLPNGVSPDNDLFLAMFLIRLPPSMREAVSSGNHKTAAAMVRAADALWARGGHNLWPPQLTSIGVRLLLGRSGATRGPALPVQKVTPLPTKIFSIFKTPAMACASITITIMQEPTGM